MNRETMRTGRVAILLLSLLASVPAVGDFIVDWWTIAGGGDMWATEPNSQFELSGTIGQPHAGTPMTGGNFALIGGFWPLPTAPPILIGDLNCDSTVGFGDINPFVLFLSNFPAWQATYLGCPPENGDINADGLYPDFADINPFVALLTGQ